MRPRTPVARARDGMASDSATKIPGPTTASVAEITQLMATATTTFGESANATDASDVRMATREMKRISPRISVMKCLVM